MTSDLSRPVRSFINYLGELGPRWGLPAAPVRVHGHPYVDARPAAEAELRAAAGLRAPGPTGARSWRAAYRVVTNAGRSWRTARDPWALLSRAIEERRRREIAPALDLLRACQRDLQGGDAAGKTAS